MTAPGRLCCKIRFALVMKISAGRRFGFRVGMWGISSLHVKRTGDFGNAIEGIRIGDWFPCRVFAKNSEPCNFRLLQHGVIPGSSLTKVRESALQEQRRPAYVASQTMESDDGALCRTGRVVETDIDLCGERDRFGYQLRRPGRPDATSLATFISAATEVRAPCTA